MGLPLSVAAVAVWSVSLALRPGGLGWPYDFTTNPVGVDGWPSGLVQWPILFLVGVTVVVSAASLVVRSRRSDATVREQLKWVTFAAVLAPAVWMPSVAAEEVGLINMVASRGLINIAFSMIPVAATVAILRYRLYDIDWIINRTLVYVPLTALLAGFYISMIGVFRPLLASDTSDLAVALATIIVVAMLTPLKNNLQERVDRRFKESADPARKLKKLAAESRSAIEVLDPEQFVQRFLETSSQMLGAPGCIAHLDSSGVLKTVTSGETPSEAAVTLPLSDEGRQLGLLELAPRKNGRSYTAAEIEALGEFADVVAYLLRLQSREAAGRL